MIQVVTFCFFYLLVILAWHFYVLEKGLEITFLLFHLEKKKRDLWRTLSHNQLRVICTDSILSVTLLLATPTHLTKQNFLSYYRILFCMYIRAIYTHDLWLGMHRIVIVTVRWKTEYSSSLQILNSACDFKKIKKKKGSSFEWRRLEHHEYLSFVRPLLKIKTSGWSSCYLTRKSEHD